MFYFLLIFLFYFIISNIEFKIRKIFYSLLEKKEKKYEQRKKNYN